MKKAKAKKQRVSAVELPQDAVVEILSRLPVKTLLRFKCVCKLWNSLISDPNFVLSTSGRERIIVRSYSEPMSFYSIDDEFSVVKLPIPHVEYLDDSDKFKFLGSCNGLVLFLADEHLYLWNPLTNSCRLMPQLNDLVGKLNSRYPMSCGFCFDKSSDDYKVVTVTMVHTGGGINSSVYVASLKEGKMPMEFSIPYRFSYSYPHVLEEHLHWIVKEKIGSAQLILYFDQEANQFRELSLPDDHEYGDAVSVYYFGFTILDGCLCISRHLNHDATDVLIMREYGVKHSWTRLFTLRGHFVPLHARISDNLALVTDHEYLYTYKSQNKYTGKIKGQADQHHQRRYYLRNKACEKIKYGSVALKIKADPLKYMESLASVDSI
ncbi:OLC1v1009894C1 [Oldenlandia corymbosa var. corymbosa]|uniref:OLC1v1009894C1 n=1 Tax=Oldenlandia corymbosa var. corymbosa TaxID=529605 RepID=A0AAV1DSF7_OLDCO|nr:OLC1v1009894C1 [Oldenlandia corymbosa var. corymbosa]